MLTLFVSIIPLKEKKTEMLINAYMKYIHAVDGGSKFIISDNGKEFSSASKAYISDQLGFTKVYIQLFHHVLTW